MQKTVLVVSILMMAGMAAAAPSDLPKPSQTPGDTFYFLDRFSERMELAVAKVPVIGSPELEAKVRANHAAERLAEARKLAEKNESEKVDRLMEEYSEQVNMSVRNARKANDTELSRRLGNVSDNHVEVLQDVQRKVPEPAKKGIQNAIENSQKNRRELGIPEAARNRGIPDTGAGDERGNRQDQAGKPDGPVGKSTGGMENRTPEADNMTEEEEIRKRSEELTERLKQTVGNGTGSNKTAGNATEEPVEQNTTVTEGNESSEETLENGSEITGEAVRKPSFADRS